MSADAFSLPDLLVEPLVRAALAEDLGGAGDLTSQATLGADLRAEGVIAARDGGVIAGIGPAALAFRLLDPGVSVTIAAPDGQRVDPGAPVLHLSGRARAILSAERVALNLLCHLSGIASATARFVAAVRPYGARITCTRKTTPGLRALEKLAVRAGGGTNHRFGLDDAVLIKDNHIALAGGIATAVARARAAIGPLVKIEVEVDRPAQLAEALAAKPDLILLDNMSLADLRASVAQVAGAVPTEASGGITLETAAAVAATGVDYLSVGWLTRGAPSLDLGLDIA